MKQSILILCHENVSKAPRVLKQVNALKESYEITIAGYEGVSISDVQFIDLAPCKSVLNTEKITFHLTLPVLLRKLISFFIKYFILFEFNESIKYKNRYWTSSRKAELTILQPLDFDLIITHHLNSLPLALKLSKSKKVPLILNAHEYYPREFEDNTQWLNETQPTYLYYCKKLLPKVNQMFSVGAGIREEYLKEFNVDSIVIPNDKRYYTDLNPSIVDENCIKLVHHRAAIRERKLEVMIELMEFLPNNYELIFILMPVHKAYYKELHTLAAKHQNIRFVEAVDVEKIPRSINKYEIGIFILANNNFNYEYALPNKFFEFVQARLCLAISPNIEMKNIINKYQLGVVAEDFSAEKMAEKIHALSITEIRHYKEQSHKFAYELSSEKTEQTIVDEVNKLLI
jgi:hypothetical protein